MLSANQILASLGVLLLCSSFSAAVPWDLGSISSTIGAEPTYIQAMGPYHQGEVGHTRHIMGLSQGQPGNVTITENAQNPAFFFVRKSQFYQYVNATTIYPVNVHNVTIPRAPPLQLVLGEKPGGLKGGHWRFSGNMLYYDFPGRDDQVLKVNNPDYINYSQGLFYNCVFLDGNSGVFMFYYLQDAGVDCFPFTLHSFMNEKTK